MVPQAFTGLLDALNSINIEWIIKDAVEKHASEIEDLNIDQLNAGRDATGNAITPPYTPVTVAIKQAKGQQSNVVTLKDEGSFHKSIFAKTHQNAFEMDAADEKKQKLVEKYGEQILGLTEENIQETSEIIEETVIKSFEQQFSYAPKKSRRRTANT